MTTECALCTSPKSFQVYFDLGFSKYNMPLCTDCGNDIENNKTKIKRIPRTPHILENKNINDESKETILEYQIPKDEHNFTFQVISGSVNKADKFSILQGRVVKGKRPSKGIVLYSGKTSVGIITEVEFTETDVNLTVMSTQLLNKELSGEILTGFQDPCINPCSIM
jgi:hypothetical protein